MACEFSGIVRDAFIARGHDAMSCDLLPTERPGPHYQGNIVDILNDGWDLMIAHPPCTYLTNAGIGYFNVDRYGEKAIQRSIEREKALRFFLKLYYCHIPKVCIENPQGYVNSRFRKPNQTIHPYYFGDPHMKRTCLWLRGLPRLNGNPSYDKPKPISIQTRRPGKNYEGGEIKNRYFVDVKSSMNWKERAKTFPGIARSMAEQWG